MAARVGAEQPTINLNNILAGTIDGWVLWNLTGAQVHATDHSNASRTMLMNLDSQEWDPMLRFVRHPRPDDA